MGCDPNIGGFLQYFPLGSGFLRELTTVSEVTEPKLIMLEDEVWLRGARPQSMQEQA